MRKYLLALALIVVFANVAINYASADDSVYDGSGYDVYPIRNTDVQLVAERIRITDNRAFGITSGQNFSIEVDMTFKNQGLDTTVQMGFPVLVTEDEGELIEIDTHFRTWVNSLEVQIEKKSGLPNPKIQDSHFSKTVYTYVVSFKQGETKQIRHMYDVGGSSNSMGGWALRYILRTGALWKDAIEDYSMLYKTKVANVHEIIGTLPREQKSELVGEDMTLIWDIKNFKPKNDFKLIGGSSRFPLVKRTISEDKKSIEIYRDIMTAAEIRYAKNKVYASYGYPFKSSFVHAQFYYPGSPYKESASFKESAMRKDHLAYVEWLSKLEEEKLKSEK